MKPLYQVLLLRVSPEDIELISSNQGFRSNRSQSLVSLDLSVFLPKTSIRCASTLSMYVKSLIHESLISK